MAIENATLYDGAVAARRAREDLLATVSHDLKNPLNAVKLSTRTLARRLDDEKAKASLARIDRAAERMSRLIDDLLNAAKIEAGALRVAPSSEDAFTLIDSMAESFREVAAEKGIRLVTSRSTSDDLVLCERGLILRVLANLVGNAIKFSSDGSSISLCEEARADQVMFSVADTGPGIPAEHVPHASIGTGSNRAPIAAAAASDSTSQKGSSKRTAAASGSELARARNYGAVHDPDRGSRKPRRRFATAMILPVSLRRQRAERYSHTPNRAFTSRAPIH